MTDTTTTQNEMTGQGAVRAPNWRDREIGLRVQALRREAGLSQHELAESLAISPQQVGKYERGQNRMSAGRLAEIACVLGCTTTDLAGASAGPCHVTPEAIQLAQTFDTLLDPGDRAALSHMARRLAQTSQADAA